MIKISALNEETEEEDTDEEGVSKEALEQIALQQYAKALDLQRKENFADATQLLKDLLNTELLYEVKKPAPGDKVSGPLFHLKYLCYQNLGSMLNTVGDVEAAIEAYVTASELDDADVTLWYRLGLVCMRAERFEMALNAFQHGVQRNPRHWPCLDKIVTLLLALDDLELCIITIHDALKLDPGYLRGIVYKRHIYTVYTHMKDYMEYLNPMYKFKDEDEPIDEELAEKLIKEVVTIKEAYIKQQKKEEFKHIIPNVKLKKPISRLTWESIGDSLVNMHHYMTEFCFSHACFIEICVNLKDTCQEMEVVEVPAKDNDETEIDIDENVNDKIIETASEIDANDITEKDKVGGVESEKLESDVEMVTGETASEGIQEVKAKKPPARRRGSALSLLEQWVWCSKRRSGRKKATTRQDTIYDTLRRMVPLTLASEEVHKNDDEIKNVEVNTSPLDAEEKQEENMQQQEYFGTEREQTDVKSFIAKYSEKKKDIIDMLRDFLSILSKKWKVKWPTGLSKVFIEANECYNSHIDVPTSTGDSVNLIHYISVNMLVEEFEVNNKLITLDNKQNHNLSCIESVNIILTLNPLLFPSIEFLEIILRHLWLKVHILILNKREDFALDNLYQLLHEFDAMGEYSDAYSLNLVNFTFKDKINKNEILEYIKFLERNKNLSTVKGLYNKGCYEECLSIITDSFDLCKTMAKKDEKEMALDFAVQLSLILDCYWALNKADICFKWSFTCLHEALKHYFRFTSGSAEYEKWTLCVVKILSCMEHILSTEGLSCIGAILPKELGQGLEDLIRIIGHQLETNSTDMPFDSVLPWIIMHYILQREEDQGRGRYVTENDRLSCDDVPNPLMLLFLAHEQLGNRGWCCKSNGKLLYFILDTVAPRIRSPSLSKSLEQVCMYLEQCVYCLFGHKKSKVKYLHCNTEVHELDWIRAQQLYEIFRPPVLPVLEGKISGITADTENLLHRILVLLPPECDPQKYLPEMDRYIKGLTDKLPSVPPLLPYNIKDIYFLLGDFYFKKEDNKMAIKFNTLDVIINNDRMESWAQISLSMAVILERTLNSCKNLNSDKDFLNPAKSAIRCFKRALQLNPTHSVCVEYGNFVYYVHSFCSRLLKQASESLSMEDFESLEKQKEDLLDTTNKCFTKVVEELSHTDCDSDTAHTWLYYYMLGKVAEKKNKPPSVYLSYYMKGVKCLQEADATYPQKINYSSPTNFCIEVLELHYRIHASILKYIEQHENKPIPTSVGRVFSNYIKEWQQGPFMKKNKKDNSNVESQEKTEETHSIQAANILKRSVSDAGEEDATEAKKLKSESAAAKVRRSASYDTERIGILKEPIAQNSVQTVVTEVKNYITEKDKNKDSSLKEKNTSDAKIVKTDENSEIREVIEATEENREVEQNTKEDSSTSTSSTSSSDSSSSGSSSDSSEDSSGDSDSSSKSSEESKPLTDDELMKIVSACLDALEDCASRFPPHYKAIYRLAHYHFYYKKGKDIARCRDLMLSTFTSRCGQKLGGLFSERRNNNFFNNIWKIPHTEVERAGGFAFHMNRSVLLTMEILKEIDDYKTLLDLSLHLQKVPDLDKTYLRDSDREELAQQAFSLCIQSLKGQLMKFCQQADLKSNEVEQQALKSLIVDIYRAYTKVQKQPNSIKSKSNLKQFINLLVDAYKLVTTTPITENMNLVDLSLKYSQSLKLTLANQAIQASLDKSQNAQKKQPPKIVESAKTSVAVPVSQSKPEVKSQTSTTTSSIPKMSSHDIAAAFQNYPMLNDPVQQTAAALSLSYLSNLSGLAGYSSLQNSLQTSLQNSFQAEFYRQFFSSYHASQKKQKRGPKPTRPPVPIATSSTPHPKTSKSFSVPSSVSKSAPTSVIVSQKSTLTPSMGTVLSTLPASMTANLAPFSSHSHTASHSYQQTHSSGSKSSTSKLAVPHQQVSPGKTLQEKLAERQKHNPKLSKSTQDINASISKLPSSLTITKTTTSKQPTIQSKKPEPKKAVPFEGEARPKPITTDEIIILDDD